MSRFRGILYKASGVAPAFHARARAVDASLVHAHFAVDGVNALPLASAIKRPLMVSLHGNDVTTREEFYRQSVVGRIFLARRHRLWHQASMFACVSDFIRKKAIESGFPSEKLVVHYIGIDLTFFKPVESADVPRTVVFVGRLVEKKGCRYLIEAMRPVQSNFPDARFVVIGGGPERESLEALAKSLGVRCEFMGVQPSSVVRKELATARIFCVPSIEAVSGDSEGFGIVFAEAQAMGVPVVSTMHGGIPEVVAHERTGLLAPERNPEALAAHINRFFADETFWLECKRNTVSWIAERFDIRKQTSVLEDLYERIATKAQLGST
jgi:colanic acid/amylovoran biosynthesis glycosyltransferase